MFVSGRLGEVGNGSRTQPLGIHRSSRSPADAADEPLARPALVSHLDDRRHTHGRWLDLVRPGADVARLWRHAAFFGHRRCGVRRSSGYFCFQTTEENEPAAEALQIEPHCWSKVLPPDKFSFPSGHTMTTFSIALVVSYFYPSLEGALFFLALSIAVSRIVLGMHFLSDVLAGVLMGVALGCASITAFASFGLI